MDIGLAALLVGAEVEPTLDVDQWLGVLDGLAAGCPSPDLAGLQSGLQLFGGTEDDFNELRSSLLPEVLRRGRGLPLLLSIVWVEVATRLGVPASYAVVPGRVVVSEYVDVAKAFYGQNPPAGAAINCRNSASCRVPRRKSASKAFAPRRR